jgi:hypothetical protein
MLWMLRISKHNEKNLNILSIKYRATLYFLNTLDILTHIYFIYI